MKKKERPKIIIEDKVVLHLYVSGMSAKSMEAIENIGAISGLLHLLHLLQ